MILSLFSKIFLHLFFSNTVVIESALVTFTAKFCGVVYNKFLPFSFIQFVPIGVSVKITALARVYGVTTPITLTTLSKLLTTPNFFGRKRKPYTLPAMKSF